MKTNKKWYTPQKGIQIQAYLKKKKKQRKRKRRLSGVLRYLKERQERDIKHIHRSIKMISQTDGEKSYAFNATKRK